MAQQWGGALALYAQLWRLGGVSDADGFAGTCYCGSGGDKAVVAEVAVRQRRQGF